MRALGGEVLSNTICPQLSEYGVRQTFYAGPSLTFDEGGIPTRSRFCPGPDVQQDKPDKFG
jgi:hypothetical protein